MGSPAKTKFLWGENPLQNLYLLLMIGIYIHIMERGIKGGEVDKQAKDTIFC